MSDTKQFVRSYWDYFLELEDQFLETKRFVAFSPANSQAYSIEYLKLFQAVCSEIDVVGKEIAVDINPNFEISKKTTIKNWGYEVQQGLPTLKNTAVRFNDEISVQPFRNWEYERNYFTDKDGKKKSTLRIKNNKNAIAWWSAYNDIKHRRIGLVEGTENFQKANQKNLILAFAGLFALEALFLSSLPAAQNIDKDQSKLFSLEN